MLCLFLGGLWFHNPAFAQLSGQEEPSVFEGVGIDPQLGEVIPGDLTFRNEQGEAVALQDYFDGERPILLTLVYHNCPMLCNVFLDKVTASLRDLAWKPGAEFEMLTVSFNAIETPALAARQKERYVDLLGAPEAADGWHFLTGNQEAISALTDAVGFSYRWVEEQQEFAHPTALIFLSGDGKITRYLPGIDFPARNIRTALVEASEGTVGTALDQIYLYCFRYDPQANSYAPYAVNIMKIGGLLTALALGATLLVLWRREGGKRREELQIDN